MRNKPQTTSMQRVRSTVLLGIMAFTAPMATLADTVLAAAVLPTSRSVQVNDSATLFATLINGGTEDARNCRIEADANVPSVVSYQTTDPATNAVTGSPNTPVRLDPGEAQSFVVVLTPTQEVNPTEVALGFVCDNAPRVATISGVNTFDFSASTSPVADIVALALTPTADGVVAVPTTSRINAFSVASVNLGASATVEVQATLSDAQAAASLSMCQTDPATAACINPTAPTAEPVTAIVDNMGTPTFAVFVTSNGDLAFDPAGNRVSVKFTDTSGAVRGATSVAIRSRQLAAIEANDLQGTTLWSESVQPGQIVNSAAAQNFNSDGTGTTYENSLAFVSAEILDGVEHQFTWSINSAGELQQDFIDYQTLDTNTFADTLSDLLFRYDELNDAIFYLIERENQGTFVGPLEVELNTLSRTTTASTRASGTYSITSLTTTNNSIDAMLLRNEWTEPLPRTAATTESRDWQILSAGNVASIPGQIANSGDTWALPYRYSPQTDNVQAPIDYYAVDIVTLQADGTTTPGRLSNQVFNWENQGQSLVLSAGDESYRYTTIDTLNGQRSALVEYTRDGELLLVESKLIARIDGTGSTLAADLVQGDTEIWQAGINTWWQERFREDGLIRADLVFGYQFNNDATAIRALGETPEFSSCPSDTTGCFLNITGPVLWSWTSTDNVITRRLVSPTLDRTRTWEVLSYTPGGVAVIFEYAIWTFDQRSPEFVILPRLNSLRLIDLQDWQEEFANSPDFNGQ